MMLSEPRRLKMEGRRVRPRLPANPGCGRLTLLLEQWLEVASEAIGANEVESLARWAARFLGREIVRAALRRAIAAAGTGALRRALREQLALLNAQ